MALLQYARGLFGRFAQAENPYNAFNGMEENLRLIDDHLGLYTVLPPQAPGTPYPANAVNGDGQIYTDGTYAVYNAGEWKQYNPRRGVNALEPDGTRWGNTGVRWVNFQGVARAELAGPGGAEIVGAFDKTQAARWVREPLIKDIPGNAYLLSIVSEIFGGSRSARHRSFQARHALKHLFQVLWGIIWPLSSSTPFGPDRDLSNQPA